MLLAGLFLGFLLAGPASQGASAGPHDGRLDLNTASFRDIRALPGMGDEYVRRVIAGRPYTAKNQLVTRGVLPQSEYARIADRIVAHRGQNHMTK